MAFPARPSVSFVIATYNRGSVAVDCLQRTLTLARAALGSHFSIIAIDNASTDDTADQIEKLAAGHANMRLIRLSRNCGPVAKNIGIHNNPADIIVVLDDDAYPLSGSLPQMVRHFQDDSKLAAAVFDVTLPDGAKEASAYPDVFIGAGTALRGEALRSMPDGGILPRDFFMQAEEYDLSFRLLAGGWTIQRFWDMPLMHLKAPGARIGQRTTRLDIRNNLWLLAKYVPEPLCYELSADWLARYWRMAVQREAHSAGHKAAFIKGAAEGLGEWAAQRRDGRLLDADTIERIFKFEAIEKRMGRLQKALGLRRIAFGDWGKNMLPMYRAAQRLGLEVTAVVDSALATTTSHGLEYRGIPIVPENVLLSVKDRVDAIIMTTLSPVHASRRTAAFRRTFGERLPVLDLFSKQQARASEMAREGISASLSGVTP